MADSDVEIKTSGDEQEKEKSNLPSLLILIFIGCMMLACWAQSYYYNHPLEFKGGQKVYTVVSDDLNLLPNEEENYLGKRAASDDATEYVYRACDMDLVAASAFSIRTGPGVYYQSIGRMYYGRDVHVIAISDDNEWYMIDFYGDEAYVHSACLFEELPQLRHGITGNSNTASREQIGLDDDPESGSLLDEVKNSEVTSETDVEEITGTTPSDVSAGAEETVQTEETEAAAAATATPEPTATPTPEPTPVPVETSPVETVPVSAAGPSDPTMLELFNLVNNARTQAGLSPLSWSGSLASAAGVRAAEITINFSHTRPDGSEWWTVNPDIMYGENLASGQSSAQEAFNSWMASPGHYANIMNPGFTTCGFAFYYGGDAGSTYYWVQEFGY